MDNAATKGVLAAVEGLLNGTRGLDNLRRAWAEMHRARPMLTDEAVEFACHVYESRFPETSIHVSRPSMRAALEAVHARPDWQRDLAKKASELAAKNVCVAPEHLIEPILKVIQDTFRCSPCGHPAGDGEA